MKKNIVFNIIIILIVLLILYAFFQKCIIKKNVNIFGISIYIVTSGSMEPKIKINDAIIIVKSNCYKIGDIITYEVENEYNVTHRIIEVTSNGYKTKGDNNNTFDKNIVKSEQIKGKVFLNSSVIGFLINNNILIVVFVVIIYVFQTMFKKGG